MGFLSGSVPEHSSALIEGCYAIGEVPGRRVTEALGLVQFTKKGIAGEVPNVSADIFASLRDVAEECGANAVINVRVIAGSYQQYGSGWFVTYLIAYGDAVVLS